MWKLQLRTDNEERLRGVNMLNQMIDIFYKFNRYYKDVQIKDVEFYLSAILLEEILTLKVASISRAEYNTNRNDHINKLVQFVRTQGIISLGIIKEEHVVDLVELYFNREFEPRDPAPVRSGDNVCEWRWGCPSHEGPLGSFSDFDKDHIIPNCTSTIGSSGPFFDPDCNSQKLCKIHNRRIKKDNIAIGYVTRILNDNV